MTEDQPGTGGGHGEDRNDAFKRSYRSRSFNSGGRRELPQGPDVLYDLFMSLDEIYKGETRRVPVTRRLVSDGGIERTEEKVFTIDVKRGWKAGTKIRFQKEGDHLVGRMPADLVFVIRDKPHPYFKREGSDIHYKCNITLTEALCGMIVDIPTLTSEKIPINLDNEIVKPSTEKRIPGYGLPLTKEPNKFGDILVSFDIQFPNKLSQKDKDLLYVILSS